METQEAIKIVSALADGIDPDGGNALSQETILRNPRIVIALHRATGALEALAERERERQNQPPNANRYWTKAEEEQLCAELREGGDFRQIAKKHDRTVPSIVARLIKLGKIAPKSSEPLFPVAAPEKKKVAS